LSDILVPAGAAIVALQFLSAQSAAKRRGACWMYAALLFLSTFDLCVQARHFPWPRQSWNPVISRANKFMNEDDWRDVARWAADHTAPGTIFITPKSSNSFKWYSARDEVATWKDMPQDAQSVLQWYHRLDDVFTIHGLRDLSSKYGAQYAIVERSNLLWSDAQPIYAGKEPVYENASYAVYQLDTMEPVKSPG
jgi:hypothetical protein